METGDEVETGVALVESATHDCSTTDEVGGADGVVYEF